MNITYDPFVSKLYDELGIKIKIILQCLFLGIFNRHGHEHERQQRVFEFNISEKSATLLFAHPYSESSTDPSASIRP
jgi:hypothetical protein